MAVVTKKNFEEIYSNIISDYLKQGYYINPEKFSTDYFYSCRCSKSLELIPKDNKNKISKCAWIVQHDEIFYDETYDRYESIEVLDIIVTNSKIGCSHTINNDNTIFRKSFYKVTPVKKVSCSDKNYYFYTDNFDEAVAAYKLSLKRIYAHDIDQRDSVKKMKFFKIENMSESFIDSIMERINNRNGFKKATIRNIDKVFLTRYYNPNGTVTHTVGTIQFSMGRSNDSIYMYIQ